MRVVQQPVEASIALSIAFVAAEIVHGHQGRPGLTQRLPSLIEFAFGLLHGLGFAAALAKVGLPNCKPLRRCCSSMSASKSPRLALIVTTLSPDAAGQWLAGSFRVAWPAWSARVLPCGIGGMARCRRVERTAAF